MKDDKENTCKNCMHSRWMVAVGQGFRCHCPKNKYVLLSEHSEKRKFPYIPNRQFCCEHWESMRCKK